jgi:hypothetical protein
MSWYRRVSAPVALLALTLAACGGGGGGSSSAVPGSSSASPANALLTPAGIYVVDIGGRITVLAPFSPSSFDPMVLGTITGGNTALQAPASIAVDANGTIYVGNTLAGTTSSGSVTVYAPMPRGTLNEAPIATIAGDATGLDGYAVYDVAVDASGKIYVDLGDRILIFAANPHGVTNQPPLATITSADPQHPLLAQARSMTVDASGKIYVANAIDDVLVFPANLSGTQKVMPSAIITGPATGLHAPRGIALDASGRIYVSSIGSETVNVYAPNPSGTINEAPLASIKTTIGASFGIAVDSAGYLYVTNDEDIAVYAPNVAGDVDMQPLASFSGSRFSLSSAVAVAVR